MGLQALSLVQEALLVPQPTLAEAHLHTQEGDGSALSSATLSPNATCQGELHLSSSPPGCLSPLLGSSLDSIQDSWGSAASTFLPGPDL